jgi:hypothetical protein
MKIHPWCRFRADFKQQSYVGVCVADHYVFDWYRVDISQQVRIAEASFDIDAEQGGESFQP